MLSPARSVRPGACVALVTVALAGAGCGSSSKEGSTSTATSPAAGARAALEQRVADADAAAKAKPRSAQAFADLAEAHYLAAGADVDPIDNSYGAAGKAHLQRAADAWERSLGLKPKRPDIAVASMMSLAYGQSGLNEPRKAIAAQLIVTEIRNDSSSYQTLARMAYDAGDTRTGDLAVDRALKLAPASDRKRLRDGFRDLRAGRFPGTR
jgi:hypothetical protein